MASIRSFTCPHCGETHEGLPTDRGYSLPDEVWAIPEPERAARAKWTTDLCQMGERYFIRCILRVPVTDRIGDFRWGLWVEVPWPVFERYLAVYDSDGSSEPPHPATIANELPGYGRTLGESVSVQFGAATDRPTIHFPAGATCQLALEQAQGIDAARHHQILESLT
jgi:hypothetical protein